jgi:hypothetical protein
MHRDREAERKLTAEELHRLSAPGLRFYPRPGQRETAAPGHLPVDPLTVRPSVGIALTPTASRRSEPSRGRGHLRPASSTEIDCWPVIDLHTQVIFHTKGEWL